MEIYVLIVFSNAKRRATALNHQWNYLWAYDGLFQWSLGKACSYYHISNEAGAILFYPPNVAGWPGGKNWIDSSALMLRMRIPQILTDADDFVVKPKDDDDTMMGMEGVDSQTLQTSN